MMAIKVIASLFLPFLSGVQGLRVQFDRRYLICSVVVSLLAAVISISFIVAGGWLVRLVYGQKYAAAAGFIGWLGAMWALRMFRVAPTIAATALGDTKNAMISNVARTAAFVGVLIVAAAGYSLAWIAACGFGGELLALLVCVWRLQRQHAVAASLCLKPSVVSAAGMVAAILAATWVRTAGWVSAFVISPLLVAMVCITMVSIFPCLRPDLLAFLSRPKPPLREQELQVEVEV
jgi:O-antigen/teichoic acid export membrane protein